jgi:pimeloyl-ACP methyl ester carboxylesterase
MRCELVSIPTPGEPIDGLFYRPEDAEPVAAALIFHGNCMNFYTGPSRFLPPALVARGIACLAFNRRGHDMVASLSGRGAVGGSFQLASEGIADNRAAADWMARRGFPSPAIIGHSNGGMLATQYCAENYRDPPALVLMSAHCGGRSNVPLMSAAGLFAGTRLAELTAQAEAMVAAGQGRALMLLPGWWWTISAESFLDRVHNTPDTVANAPNIRCPSLFLRGDQEDRDSYPAEAFAAAAGAPCVVKILPGCNHFYHGHENAVACQVADWLHATLRVTAPG